MAKMNADFKQRLSRLPKRQVASSYDPIFESNSISSIFATLSFLVAGVIGFVLFLVLPHFFLAFATSTDGTDGQVVGSLLDPIWTLPSVVLAFAGSVLVLSAIGLTTGSHFKAVGVGIALAALLVRAVAG